jgi:hypothetical protein
LIQRYSRECFSGTSINKAKLFTNLIAGQLTDEQLEYVNSVCVLRNRDSRTPEKYARELVVSWLLEDATSILFEQYGVRIWKSGADKDREFLSEYQITNDADSKILFNGTKRSMEIIYDHTGFWKRTGKIDLRHNKHQHLQEMEALLFCLSTQDMQAALIDYSCVVNAVYEMHEQYQKPVMSIVDMAGQFKPAKLIVKGISQGAIV